MQCIFTRPADTGCSLYAAIARYLAPLRACFVREMEVSGLLRVYLGSMIGHLRHMAPSAGAITTTTTTQLHASKQGGGMGVNFSKGSKTLVEWSMKLSTKEQKQAPRKFDRGVSDVWKASLSLFPALWIHYQLLGSPPPPRAPWWIPDERGMGEEEEGRCQKKRLASQRRSCTPASVTPLHFAVHEARLARLLELVLGLLLKKTGSKNTSLTPGERQPKTAPDESKLRLGWVWVRPGSKGSSD